MYISTVFGYSNYRPTHHTIIEHAAPGSIPQNRTRCSWLDRARIEHAAPGSIALESNTLLLAPSLQANTLPPGSIATSEHAASRLHRYKRTRCSWLLAPGSWLLAPGSWLLAPGSWLLAPGSWLDRWYKRTRCSRLNMGNCMAFASMSDKKHKQQVKALESNRIVCLEVESRIETLRRREERHIEMAKLAFSNATNHNRERNRSMALASMRARDAVIKERVQAEKHLQSAQGVSAILQNLGQAAKVQESLLETNKATQMIQVDPDQMAEAMDSLVENQDNHFAILDLMEQASPANEALNASDDAELMAELASLVETPLMTAETDAGTGTGTGTGTGGRVMREKMPTLHTVLSPPPTPASHPGHRPAPVPRRTPKSVEKRDASSGSTRPPSFSRLPIPGRKRRGGYSKITSLADEDHLPSPEDPPPTTYETEL
jgi:hypothetical protein